MYKFKDELDMFYSIKPYSVGTFNCKRAEQAQEALKNGINLTKHYNLEVFITPMGDYADLSRYDFKKMFNNDYVVLVAVPKEIGFQKDESDFTGMGNASSEFSALFELGYDGIVASNKKDYKRALDIFKNKTRTGKIPTEFILGYVDVKNDEFVVNGGSIYTTLDGKKIEQFIKPQVDFLNKELRYDKIFTKMPIQFLSEAFKNVKWQRDYGYFDDDYQKDEEDYEND